MKKPTHFHTGTSGLIRFVTLVKEKGRTWTSDGYDTNHVFDINLLLGHEVLLKGHKGIITGFLSDKAKYVPGKYIGDGRYLTPKCLTMFNQLVSVYWLSGNFTTWQNINHLQNDIWLIQLLNDQNEKSTSISL